MAYGQPFYTYPNAGYTPYQAPVYNPYQPQPQMPTMAQNQPVNGFQPQGQANNQPQAQQAVMPTKTNVPLVTSLTEAMSRTAELNSDTFYADQDNPFIYRVSVDMQGRKSYRTFELKDVTEQTVAQSAPSATANIDLSAYATKDDLRALRDEITNYAMAYLNPSVTPNTATTPALAQNIAPATPATPKPKKTVAKTDSEETNKE